ncbi:hypothetical protein FSP39_010959 [Pinctada imbricata]|uniref:Uncharacterized protein n=1 Tax=Pinctada imbricata TaxID=66713 RepID=A0AA88XCU5_PINIB|nr:hypothetical protein FSP39_010959 [Pinctada imbricata]
MMRIAFVLLAIFAWTNAQAPSPCVAPTQFAARISQYNHGTDTINRFIIQYDAINERWVLFEEMDAFSPGRRFYEYLILTRENVEYKFDQRSHECTKAPARPWRAFGIPPNGTFENEFTLGGPGEMFVAQQWSDRVPLRTNAQILVDVTLINCFPLKEVLISNNNVTQTTTTDFYDVLEGNPNPNDFVPPKECLTAKQVQDKPFTHWP